MSAIETLEPDAVWRHFAALCRIPRPSGGELEALRWIEAWARDRGFEVASDRARNMVVRVPASRGREGAPIVVLQAHVDMVCESSVPELRDPARDGVEPFLDGGRVRARETTLGADNGLGVAAALAAAEDPRLEHGPLELLLTTAEEVGLEGVKALDPALVRGRLVVNLDGQSDGRLIVACAGGADVVLELEGERAAVAEPALSIELSGGIGGHSGIDVNAGRANAVAVLARGLAAIEEREPLRLAALEGGRSRNAIPRSARALVTSASTEATARAIRRALDPALAFLRRTDPGLTLSIAPAAKPSSAWTRGESARLLALAAAVPSGVLAMDPEIAGLPLLSLNLGVAETDGAKLRLTLLVRSGDDAARDLEVQSLRALARLAGARSEARGAYSAWRRDADSSLVRAACQAHLEALGFSAALDGVHFGLECGVLAGLLPGAQMVSLGPTIEGAHSPDERVEVAAVERFWVVLRALLERLAVDPS